MSEILDEVVETVLGSLEAKATNWSQIIIVESCDLFCLITARGLLIRLFLYTAVTVREETSTGYFRKPVKYVETIFALTTQEAMLPFILVMGQKAINIGDMI